MFEPDPDVVAAARRGDMAAFERIVRRYQGDVWRLVFHLVHDRSIADDATQNAFLRVYRFLPRFRGDSKFTTWLFSIARNCALDEVRRARRHKRVADELEMQHVEPRTEHGTAVEVREALATLSFELREPLVLIDVFGISYREVAAMLSVPEGTIKSRVHRAREQLGDLLRDRIEEDAGES